MTIAPTSCHDCVHLIRGTSGGQQHDACLNQKNKAKLIAAEICRTAGWHETPAQAREKHVHQSLDDNRRALLELREGYQANQVARRALMGEKGMITVHLSQAGTQVFHGSYEQARAAAEEWIQSQQRRAKDDEKQDEELPPGVNARSWAAYCSPCANRVFQALSDALKPLTTMQVAGLAGVSRETAQHVLAVMAAKGEARKVGERLQGRPTFWEEA